MNIDSFQQEAIDIDRREYVSPRADIELSFRGDRASFSYRDRAAIRFVRRSNCPTKG